MTNGCQSETRHLLLLQHVWLCFFINVCGFISTAVTENETDLDSGQSENEDKESDYFADAETSSCGSFELDVGWSDSEDEEGV